MATAATQSLRATFALFCSIVTVGKSLCVCLCVMEEECILKHMTFGQEVTEHPHDSVHVLCVCVFNGYVSVTFLV